MFMEEKSGLSAAEKGTILHFIMQHLDFHNGDLHSQIDAMVAKDLLTRQQANSIELSKIVAFLDSDLGKRLLKSSCINREIPFNMEIPCRELYKDMADECCEGETVLLQGVIDCFFEEEDGIVLVDYKTDYVPAGKIEMIKERYKLQIEYYSRALEMLTGKRVKDKLIYLFWNGEILAI
jgi:ATP-dependent helicase/nuclease subunit A